MQANRRQEQREQKKPDGTPGNPAWDRFVIITIPLDNGGSVEVKLSTGNEHFLVEALGQVTQCFGIYQPPAETAIKVPEDVQANLQTAADLECDLLSFGIACARRLPDGSVQRIDPALIIVADPPPGSAPPAESA